MLVLSRKQNEKICIGNSITVTVLRMKGKAVRLGIEAPRDINVVRGELTFDFSDEGENAVEPTSEWTATSKRSPLISCADVNVSSVALDAGISTLDT